jgi:predicted aspartyl protease
MLLTLLAMLAAEPSRAAPPVTSLEATSAPVPTSGLATETLPIATLPDDRLTVGVTVGGAGPFRFLVDTGADRTSISRQLADRLKLKPGPGTRLHSVTGASQVRTATLVGLKVSARALPNVTAPLLDEGHVGADGILGTDVLRAAEIRFDFREGLLSIRSGSGARPRTTEAGTIVVEARRRAGRLIVHGGGNPVVVRVQRGELVAAMHREVEISQPLNQ